MNNCFVLLLQESLEDEISPQGLVLVPRGSDDRVVVGPHVRGSRLRASSATGDAEVDLLLPGTARYFFARLDIVSFLSCSTLVVTVRYWDVLLPPFQFECLTSILVHFIKNVSTLMTRPIEFLALKTPNMRTHTTIGNGRNPATCLRLLSVVRDVARKPLCLGTPSLALFRAAYLTSS